MKTRNDLKKSKRSETGKTIDPEKAGERLDGTLPQDIQEAPRRRGETLTPEKPVTRRRGEG